MLKCESKYRDSFLGLRVHKHRPAIPARRGSTTTPTWRGFRTGYLARCRGSRALLSGLSMDIMKVITSTAIGFTVFDSSRQYSGLPQLCDRVSISRAHSMPQIGLY